MAVSRLRWSDFDLVSGTVRWTAQHDKTGFEHVVPLEEIALELLRAQRSRTSAIGKAWVFPSPTDRSKPISRNLARDWWERLEQAAGLRHVKGRGWHSLRRRFATDLDHLVQGLELDWVCLTWDADLRYTPKGWAFHAFEGSRWNRIHKPELRAYLRNAYRVLLTRARQGMVIFVPPGDSADHTRPPAFYDATFDYLRSVGMPVLNESPADRPRG
jgi:hypothetical protein